MAAAPLGPYAPVVCAGEWIIVSGQIGVADGKLVAGGVAAQTGQALINLGELLLSVGSSLADVVKTTCFLTDIDDFATFNDVYALAFEETRPARSTVAVAALPGGAAVELEAWARRRSDGDVG